MGALTHHEHLQHQVLCLLLGNKVSFSWKCLSHPFPLYSVHWILKALQPGQRTGSASLGFSGNEMCTTLGECCLAPPEEVADQPHFVLFLSCLPNCLAVHLVLPCLPGPHVNMSGWSQGNWGVKEEPCRMCWKEGVLGKSHYILLGRGVLLPASLLGGQMVK